MNTNACERAEYCMFFQGVLSEMPSIANRLREEFCASDKTGCARYMIHKKLREGYAPSDEVTMVKISREMQSLFPDDSYKANRIIKWLTRD
jgi:hypothetical protein